MSLERRRMKEGNSLFVQNERAVKENIHYEVVYDTLQDLGFVLSSTEIGKVVVSDFKKGTRDGALRSSPAESDGSVKIGDFLMTMDGAPVKELDAAQRFVGQRTHQEILRCRGGAVKR
jgi:hypothetical protein